jgi:hypothetical protein
MTTPPIIFISYSQNDDIWLNHLQVHLKPFIRNATVAPWVDTNIKPGEEWEKAIQDALSASCVGVLLVTPHYLATDFVFQKELPELIRKKILWIAVRHSSYQITEIAKYQALNNPSRPLADMLESERDKELVQICRRICQALPNP